MRPSVMYGHRLSASHTRRHRCGLADSTMLQWRWSRAPSLLAQSLRAGDVPHQSASMCQSQQTDALTSPRSEQTRTSCARTPPLRLARCRPQAVVCVGRALAPSSAARSVWSTRASPVGVAATRAPAGSVAASARMEGTAARPKASSRCTQQRLLLRRRPQGRRSTDDAPREQSPGLCCLLPQPQLPRRPQRQLHCRSVSGAART